MMRTMVWIAVSLMILSGAAWSVCDSEPPVADARTDGGDLEQTSADGADVLLDGSNSTAGKAIWSETTYLYEYSIGGVIAWDHGDSPATATCAL